MGLGVLWLVDASLQAEPAKFAAAYPTDDLAQSVMGLPGWAGHAVYAAIGPFEAHWAVWNLAAVVLEAALGVTLVSGQWPRAALSASMAWALVIWFVGEGFGGLPGGQALLLAGAPGPALVYVVGAGLAWPRAGHLDVCLRAWRVSWGALWLGAAVLHVPFVYGAGQVVRANLEERSLDQPGWLAASAHWLATLTTRHPLGVPIALAVLEASIGLGANLDRRHRRGWLALAVGVAVSYWVVGEQLGGVLTADATDPGLAPLLVLLALTAWPRRLSPCPEGAPLRHVPAWLECRGRGGPSLVGTSDLPAAG